jgi:hypothetical protein
MIHKRPLNSQRLRLLPPSGFGWIDHRFLREGYFQRCTPGALALYSLLVCAGDSQGLSFYGEARTAELLGLDLPALRSARAELIAAELIAFERPLCLVLALEDAVRPCRASYRPASAGTGPCAAPSPRPTPPRKRPEEVAPGELTPAPAGLDLRAMVRASLAKGGAQ